MKTLFNNKGIATLTIVLIIVGVVVVAGGTIGGVVAYNTYQEKKEKEAKEALSKAIEEEKANAYNSYNDKINQITVSLNVEKDGSSSLDNNEDIDAMSNAVNELNNLLNDINGNDKLTQEQKNELSNNINAQISAINDRISQVKSKKETIAVNPVFDELAMIKYKDLVGKYGNEIQDIPGSAMEKHCYVPSLGLDFVYEASGGIPKENVKPKHIEGKLSNFVTNVKDSMSADDLASKMSYQGSNDGVYPSMKGYKAGNPSSSVAFSDYHAEIAFTRITNQSLDEGWSCVLYITADNNGTVNPESYTWLIPN